MRKTNDEKIQDFMQFENGPALFSYNDSGMNPYTETYQKYFNLEDSLAYEEQAKYTNRLMCRSKAEFEL